MRCSCVLIVVACLLACMAQGCAGQRAELDARFANRVPPSNRPDPSEPFTTVRKRHASVPSPVVAELPAERAQEPDTTSNVSIAAHVAESDFAVKPAEANAPATAVPEPEPAVDQVSGVLRLADIERIALSNNPTISQLSASAHKASGIREQVGKYPNPIVGYQAMQLADRATDQHTLFFEQEIVLGDKLGLNQRVLDQSVEAQRWDVQSQRYRVLTDVRIRFYEALVAQREVELTREFQNVTRNGVEMAIRRKEAAEASQVEVLQAEIQRQEIDLTQRQAEFAFRGAWQDLVAVAGVPTMQPTTLEADLTTFRDNLDWDQVYGSLVASSPELAAARARVCEAQANMQRQQAQVIPNLTVQMGAGFDNATDSGMLNLQVGAPLPLHNRNEGNINAAYAEYCRATHEVKRLEMAIKSRLARASQEFDSALETVQQYDREILPNARQTLELSEQAYRTGNEEVNFLQVLMVRRTFFEANLKHVRALGELAKANARIDGLLLSGALDAPSDFTGYDSLRGQTFEGQ